MKNLTQLPSGSYRYRKMIDGVNVSITFDHEPSEKEVTIAVSKELKEAENKVPRSSFGKCCERYIESKRPVLSPSTIRAYYSIVGALSDDLKITDINDIEQIDVQNEISDYAISHSPKSAANMHGLISAVIKMFRPTMQLTTTLPQRVKYEPYTPSAVEIKQILDTSKGTRYSVPFQLGVLGMRRSEICALDLSDLDGNELKISKAKVKGDDKQWHLKLLPKTADGKRTIYVPDQLIGEIKEYGFFDGEPGAILKALNRYQQKLGIPKFRFHDLRAYYASYAHSKGVPDAVIMASGGWKSDYVMKRIYRRALEEDKKKYQKSIADDMLL